MTQHPEHQLQKSFFDWLKKCHPDWEVYFYANVNAAKLSKRQGQWLNDEGRKKGVWDVFAPIARNGYHGLYIEFKIYPNKLTPDQIKFGQRVIGNCYKTLLCYNIDDAMKWTEGYLKGSV